MILDPPADPLEADFASALFAADSAPPRGLKVPAGAGVAHRFGVYRNNVVVGLVNALASRFPVVKRLVGDDFFAAMARFYVTGNPPRSPLLFRYGDGFPSFIVDFSPATTVPYLADVARLEFMRGEAYHAADADPLDHKLLGERTVEELLAARLALHPSLLLLQSPHPVVSIWRAHQEGAETFVSDWRPEAALVTRPELDVEVRVLPPGAHTFLSAIAKGMSIGEAAELGSEDQDFDAVAAFALMLEARIVVRME